MSWRPSIAAPPPQPASAPDEPTQTEPAVTPSQSQSTHGGIISARDLMAFDLPLARQIVEGIIAEGSSLFAGKAKIGKSWWVLQAAIAVASGGTVIGTLRTDQGDVLYLALEDNRRRVKSRLKKLLDGAQVPDRLEIATEWPRLDMGGLQQIEDWLISRPDARLVIIDVLEKVKPLRQRNVDPYAHDHATMSMLTSLAGRYHVAIVAVTHLRKMAADDALDAITGTLGLSGGADASMVLKRERGQHDATLFVTGRDINEQELALKFDDQRATWHMLGQAEDYRRSEARQAIIDLLTSDDYKATPLQPKDVAKLLGRNPSTIRTHMSAMVKTGDLKAWADGKYTLIRRIDNIDTLDSLNTVDTPDSVDTLDSTNATDDDSPETLSTVQATDRQLGQRFPDVDAQNDDTVYAVYAVDTSLTSFEADCDDEDLPF